MLAVGACCASGSVQWLALFGEGSLGYYYSLASLSYFSLVLFNVWLCWRIFTGALENILDTDENMTRRCWPCAGWCWPSKHSKASSSGILSVQTAHTYSISFHMDFHSLISGIILLLRSVVKFSCSLLIPGAGKLQNPWHNMHLRLKNQWANSKEKEKPPGFPLHLGKLASDYAGFVYELVSI